MDSTNFTDYLWSIVLAGGEGGRTNPLIEQRLGDFLPTQYCTFAGSRLDPLLACLCIGLALTAAVLAIVLFKFIHDHVLKQKEIYLQRYTDVAGRVTALFTGSFAVELIFKGIAGWLPLININR